MDKKQRDEKKKTSALSAASMGRSATEQVNPHSDSSLAQTGTNISYEGATAPGSGGSVGTGYASGKQAVDPSISTNSDFEQNRAAKSSKKDEDDEEREAMD